MDKSITQNDEFKNGVKQQVSIKGSERNPKSKQSVYSGSSQRESDMAAKKVEPPKPKEEKKIVPIKLKVNKETTEKGNFLKSKQMTFGQDKKLAPSAIQDIDQRMWMKPGANTNYEDSSHQTFQNQIV
jgi:hypothetical protein